MMHVMLASVAIAALLAMNPSAHAQSSVDGRDYLIWQRGSTPKGAKELTGTPRQKSKVNKIDSLTVKQKTPGAFNPKEYPVKQYVPPGRRKTP